MALKKVTAGILDSSLEFHLGRAKENGITKEEIAAVLSWLSTVGGQRPGQLSVWQKKSGRTEQGI